MKSERTNVSTKIKNLKQDLTKAEDLTIVFSEGRDSLYYRSDKISQSNLAKSLIYGPWGHRDNKSDFDQKQQIWFKCWNLKT